MAIYVDEINVYKSGKWCHMGTDTNVEELHEFARRIGLKRSWFQHRDPHPHYDLRPSKRELAIIGGAIPVTNREMIKVTI